MTAEVKQFPNRSRAGRGGMPPLPRRRRFSLGSVLLESGPCADWVEVDVRRERGGEWTLLLKGAGEPWADAGRYDAEEIVEMVREYGIKVSDASWIRMGWRPTSLRPLEDNAPDWWPERR